MSTNVELNLTNTIDKFFDNLFSGNLYVLGTILLLAVLGLLWVAIKFDDRVIKLWNHFSSVKADERERVTKYRDHMSKVITNFKGLKMSQDLGRDLFYHYLVGEKFYILFNNLNKVCDDYLSNKISKKDFLMYNETHWKIIHNSKKAFNDKARTKLFAQGWSKEHVSYSLETFHRWFYGYTEFLAEMITISKTPVEVIAAWWILFYNIYLQSEKFGMMLNGHITGNVFEKIKIGMPDNCNIRNGIDMGGANGR